MLVFRSESVANLPGFGLADQIFDFSYFLGLLTMSVGDEILEAGLYLLELVFIVLFDLPFLLQVLVEIEVIELTKDAQLVAIPSFFCPDNFVIIRVQEIISHSDRFVIVLLRRGLCHAVAFHKQIIQQL